MSRAAWRSSNRSPARLFQLRYTHHTALHCTTPHGLCLLFFSFLTPLSSSLYGFFAGSWCAVYRTKGTFGAGLWRSRDQTWTCISTHASPHALLRIHVQCYNCNSESHLARDCTEPKKTEQESTCFHCNKTGMYLPTALHSTTRTCPVFLSLTCELSLRSFCP